VLWTRARIALQACAILSALAMLYVGLFQIGWLNRLACPGFGSGCESVALAEFYYIFGVADGLLRAAWLGILLALAQVPRKDAALAVFGLAAISLALNALNLADMHKMGGWDFWCLLVAVLSLPLSALAWISARQPFRASESTPTAPADPPQSPG
jgi:hypothetical protein